MTPWFLNPGNVLNGWALVVATGDPCWAGVARKGLAGAIYSSAGLRPPVCPPFFPLN